MASPLKGFNVLVTRPAQQADGLIAAIEALGGTAVHCPVIAIEPLDDKCDGEVVTRARQRAMALDEYQHIIFISTNAVQFGMEWIDQYWPQYPIGIHWHGIGSATVDALAAYGLAVHPATDSMDSEALLNQSLFQSPINDRALIVRGVGGRQALAHNLEQRGARVHYLECYQRSLPDYSESDLGGVLIGQDYHGICASSGESVKNLCLLMAKVGAERLKSVPLIVPGQRVAQLAEQYQFEVISVAGNASDQAMLAALKQQASASHP